jgi:hypothetical protein
MRATGALAGLASFTTLSGDVMRCEEYGVTGKGKPRCMLFTHGPGKPNEASRRKHTGGKYRYNSKRARGYRSKKSRLHHTGAPKHRRKGKKRA